MGVVEARENMQLIASNALHGETEGDLVSLCGQHEEFSFTCDPCEACEAHFPSPQRKGATTATPLRRRVSVLVAWKTARIGALLAPFSLR